MEVFPDNYLQKNFNKQKNEIFDTQRKNKDYNEFKRWA